MKNISTLSITWLLIVIGRLLQIFVVKTHNVCFTRIELNIFAYYLHIFIICFRLCSDGARKMISSAYPRAPGNVLPM